MTDLDPDQLERLAVVGASQVCDARGGVGALDSALHRVWDSPSFAGPARTATLRPGHNHAVKLALAELQPGEVLVVDGGGEVDRAVLGDLLGRQVLARGGVGVVVDGAVRDVAGFEEIGLPVVARAASPAGPLAAPLGESGGPVSVGGVVVQPGDVVVADRDGVALIPHDDALDVFTRADAAERAEKASLGQ